MSLHVWIQQMAVLLIGIVIGLLLHEKESMWLVGEPVSLTIKEAVSNDGTHTPSNVWQSPSARIQSLKYSNNSVSTTRSAPRDDPPFVPPPWIQAYIDFHKSRLEDDQQRVVNGTRVFQYQCRHSEEGGYSCGGLGDRIKGILTGFISSVSDKRVYLINWDDVQPLSTYLAPAYINWEARAPKFIWKDTEWLWIKKNVTHPFVVNPCGFHSNASLVKYRNIYIRSQRRMNTTCVESFYPDGNVTDKDMWNTIFWTLFRLTNRTKQTAQQLLGPIDPNYFVAVHLRTGGDSASSFIDPNRHSTMDSWQEFASCTARVQQALAAQCGTGLPAVYVAADSADAKNFMLQNGDNMYAAPVEIYHIDRSNTSLMENFTLANDAVWGDFKILMDATCLVVGKSGFSHMAQHMSRHQPQPRCAVYFNKCTPDVVKKTVSQNARCLS